MLRKSPDSTSALLPSPRKPEVVGIFCRYREFLSTLGGLLGGTYRNFLESSQLAQVSVGQRRFPVRHTWRAFYTLCLLHGTTGILPELAASEWLFQE